jgi:hypothetical protein
VFLNGWNCSLSIMVALGLGLYTILFGVCSVSVFIVTAPLRMSIRSNVSVVLTNSIITITNVASHRRRDVC